MPAVIGAGFGDEGKGLVTNYLAHYYDKPVVIRFNGGHQAGHTVVTGTETPPTLGSVIANENLHEKNCSHVFSNFGSGTFCGAPTYWSKFCTVHPTGFMMELNVLNHMDFHPEIFIHPHCPVTTPFELMAQGHNKDNQTHGTVGVGFGTTLQREEDHYHLLFEDLSHPNILWRKLKLIEKYYGFRSLNGDGVMDYFLAECSDMVRYVKPWRAPPKFTPPIYEGAQGLLLDQNIGFFPHVTRSNTGMTNIRKIEAENPHVYLVTRAYQTRHGNGPMTNEHRSNSIAINPNETNKDDGAQGKFRRSLLDLDLLKYAIAKQDFNRADITLVITCLDHIREDRRFTIEDRVEECVETGEFVDKVAAALGINRVLMSFSPMSSLSPRHISL